MRVAVWPCATSERRDRCALRLDVGRWLQAAASSCGTTPRLRFDRPGRSAIFFPLMGMPALEIMQVLIYLHGAMDRDCAELDASSADQVKDERRREPDVSEAKVGDL